MKTFTEKKIVVIVQFCRFSLGPVNSLLRKEEAMRACQQEMADRKKKKKRKKLLGHVSLWSLVLSLISEKLTD